MHFDPVKVCIEYLLSNKFPAKRKSKLHKFKFLQRYIEFIIVLRAISRFCVWHNSFWKISKITSIYYHKPLSLVTEAGSGIVQLLWVILSAYLRTRTYDKLSITSVLKLHQFLISKQISKWILTPIYCKEMKNKRYASQY